MARRFMRRRPFIARPGKPNFHWVRDIVSIGVTNANVTATTVLLSPTDYRDNLAVSPTGITLVRTIVSLSINPAGNPAAAGSLRVSFGVSIADQDVAAYSIDQPSLTDERWLGFSQYNWRWQGAASANSVVDGHNWLLDTKQKVKLQDDSVRLLLFNDAGSATSVQGQVIYSLLLRGDIT